MVLEPGRRFSRRSPLLMKQILSPLQMMVALDPNGLRPLSLGRLGDAYVVASETCAFDVIGATFEREVEPGE